jgi:hypothetical protein
MGSLLAAETYWDVRITKNRCSNLKTSIRDFNDGDMEPTTSKVRYQKKMRQ